MKKWPGLQGCETILTEVTKFQDRKERNEKFGRYIKTWKNGNSY